MGKKSSIINSAIFFIAITMVGKCLAFIQNMLIGNIMGTSVLSDSYLSACSYINYNILSIATAILAVLIPLFVEIRKNQGDKKVFEFANNVLNILLVISIIAVILVNIIAYLVRMQSNKLPVILTSSMISIIIFSIFFIFITYIFVAILQSMEIFLPTSMINYPYNIILIIYTWLFLSTENITYLAVITVLAWGGQAIILLPSLKKVGYKYKIGINLKDEKIRTIIKSSLPFVIVIYLVNQLNVNIDMFFSNNIREGYKASIVLSNTIYLSIVSTIVYGIVTVVYPKISEKNIEGGNSLGTYIIELLNVMFFILIPLTIGFVVLGEDMLGFIFKRGKFDETSLLYTKTVLTNYALGAVAFGVLEVLCKVYIASKKYIEPLITVISINILNLIITPLLAKPLGLHGITLATSLISTIITFGLLIYYLKNNKIEIEKNYKINLLKIILASVIMLCVISCLRSYLAVKYLIDKPLEYGAVLMVLTFIGGIVYAISLIVLKEKNAKQFINIILKK